MAFRSLPSVIEAVNRARQLSPGLRLLGVVPTMVSGRQSRHEKEVLDYLSQDYHLLLSIPRRIALQDAALGGQPTTTQYAPSSDAATAFRGLAEEVLSATKSKS